MTGWIVIGTLLALMIALLVLYGLSLCRAAGMPRPRPPAPPAQPTAQPPAPSPPDGVWAAYGGFWLGETYRPADVALFGTQSAAAAWATPRGLYVAPVPFGRRVDEALTVAARAPVLPWDEPP